MIGGGGGDVGKEGAAGIDKDEANRGRVGQPFFSGEARMTWM